MWMAPVPHDELAERRHAAEGYEARVGVGAVEVRPPDPSAKRLAPVHLAVGKIHRLAKSFSVTSDVPHVFDAIAKRDDVKSILESVQSDILPKPLNKKDVP